MHQSWPEHSPLDLDEYWHLYMLSCFTWLVQTCQGQMMSCCTGLVQTNMAKSERFKGLSYFIKFCTSFHFSFVKVHSNQVSPVCLHQSWTSYCLICFDSSLSSASSNTLLFLPCQPNTVLHEQKWQRRITVTTTVIHWLIYHWSVFLAAE